MYKVVLLDSTEDDRIAVVKSEMAEDLRLAIIAADHLWHEQWRDGGWGVCPGEADGGGDDYTITVAVYSEAGRVVYLRGRAELLEQERSEV